MASTKLDGCPNRFAHQTNRLATFAQFVARAARPTDDPSLRDTGVEAIVIMQSAYLDEYLRCLVTQATLRNPAAVREHLQQRGSDEERAGSQGWNEWQLSRAALRRVTYKNNWSKLDGIFGVLFGATIWPDEDTGRLLRDLMRIRNVYVHEGGWPGKTHAMEVETKGLIVESNRHFFKLNVLPFIGEMLMAVTTLAGYAGRLIEKHPRYL